MIIYKARYDHGPDMNPPSRPNMFVSIKGDIWVISMPVSAKTHMIRMVPEIPSSLN